MPFKRQLLQDWIKQYAKKGGRLLLAVGLVPEASDEVDLGGVILGTYLQNKSQRICLLKPFYGWEALQ